MNTRRLVSLSLLAAALTASCAAPSPSSPASSSAGRAQQAGSKNSESTTGAATPTTAPFASAAPSAPRPASDSSAGIAEGGATFAPGEPNPAQPPQTNANPLKAGSVDDNAKFADYLDYRDEFATRVTGGMRPRQLDVTDRHVLRVVDAAGHGVANATVTIAVGETPITELRTYADGRALFHPKAYGGLTDATSFTVKAVKGDLTATATVAGTTTDWEVKFAAAAEKPAAKLDMAIVLDTTGSMGGEIAKFQATIATISQRIRDLPQQPAVRFGLVAYKDQKESYVTKVTPFTTDTGAFALALNQLSAGGGGDKPEDLEAGLGDTLNTLAWDDGDAVRLSFIVTDAAPHTDYPQSTPYTDSAQLAAKKGIKLYGIGASSLEAEGEYALRQLAQWTLGKYLFVTRGGDESTGGGGTASATVDAFREGRLDDIVVDIVKAELDQLGK